MRLPFRTLLVAALLCTAHAFSQTAEWVWHDNHGAKAAPGEVRYFRKSFPILSGIIKAEANVAADGPVKLWINGKEIGTSSSWHEPLKADITAALQKQDNVIAVEAHAGEKHAAVVVVFDIEEQYGKRHVVMTDRSWLSSAEVKDGWQKADYSTQTWTNVAMQGKLGIAPYGNLFNVKPGGATAAEELTVAPGFKVELLKSAVESEGSWVAMAIDDKGRLYLSPQNKAKAGGLLRITLDDHGQVAKEDWINLGVTSAMGMLWAFDSLYVSGQGPDGQAIYRLRDTDGDGNLDKVELFHKVPGGGGEHGAHALVLGPDKKIYIIHGNSAPLIDGIATDSPVHNQEEDDFLPRIKDPVATFFDKVKAPYGTVMRTDENGTKWELFASGFRNPYDLDFNADGELFTYDSDMEWDVGLPWYRATRILHITSGAEFGFREGNAKWPDYYPDSLGSVTDIGRGSPTGVKFGTKSNFPERYKRAFFAMDWTYGRILAVHTHTQDASYKASNPLPSRFDVDEPNASGDVEVFLSGKGMPVTDLEFGKDGAMYFTVGGRGTQAGLYRVTCVDPAKATAPANDPNAAHAAQGRAIRHGLEAFHGHADEKLWQMTWEGDTDVWKALGDNDREIRYAARMAIEAQPVEQWRDRALNESEPKAGITALLALARVGSQSDQEQLLRALGKFSGANLDQQWILNELRVVEVTLMRQGRPSEEIVDAMIERLGKFYPTESFDLNREMGQILVWLGAPDVVEKTLGLMARTSSHAEQIWYANILREAKVWTPAQREQYFRWFLTAMDYKGGNSAKKFLLRIREDALAKMSDAEKAPLAALLDAQPKPAKPAAPAVVRQFQKAWTVEELTPDLAQVGQGRNFARGKEIFSSVSCVQCHHFGPDGGNVGPDLTAVGNRFNHHDLLESIIEPSKVISEQYASIIITMKNGETLMGQIAGEDDAQVSLITDPINGKKQSLKKGEIAKREISPVSLMPPALIFSLTKDEVFDLLAYLESGGNEKAPAFAPVK